MRQAFGTLRPFRRTAKTASQKQACSGNYQHRAAGSGLCWQRLDRDGNATLVVIKNLIRKAKIERTG